MNETNLTAAGNLFADLPDGKGQEVFTRLAQGGAFRLERIVSTGQASPPGEWPDNWYDQNDAEWVILLSGAADLLIEGEAQARHLEPGDFLLLPARCRHRVEATAAGRETVWLALHFSPGEAAESD